MQKALSSKHKNTIKKDTVSVSSPVINIKTFLLESKGNAPDIISFFEMIKNRLLFFFNIKETINLQKDDIDKIEELRRNKYIQRDWNYRM